MKSGVGYCDEGEAEGEAEGEEEEVVVVVEDRGSFTTCESEESVGSSFMSWTSSVEGGAKPTSTGTASWSFDLDLQHKYKITKAVRITTNPSMKDKASVADK